MEEKPRYKKGDLVILNSFGLVIVSNQINFGIVVSEPYFKWFPPQAEEAVALQYWAYDVMFGTDLVDLVPEEFLDRMVDRKVDEE